MVLAMVNGAGIVSDVPNVTNEGLILYCKGTCRVYSFLFLEVVGGCWPVIQMKGVDNV